MGTIRANRHGMLLFDFYFRGIRCREGTKLADTPKNRKVMSAQMVVMEQEIERGVFDYSHWFPAGKQLHILKPVTHRQEKFGEYFKQWLKNKYDPERKQNEIKLSTYQDYRDIGKLYLIPFFGEMSLADIEPSDMKTFADTIKGLGIPRQKHIIAPLRACLGYAVEMGDIEKSPYKKIAFGKLKTVPREINPFSLAEVKKFLEHCPEWWREYFVIAFFTGMRPGEQIALKWSRVDLERRHFKIVESRLRTDEGQPKTRASIREVMMQDRVYDAFVAQKQKTAELGEYVFLNSSGNLIRIDVLSHHPWRDILTAAELEYRNPYQTRHTAITMMVMAGENPHWVAAQTGTSIEMIYKRYFKYIAKPGRDGEAFKGMLEG